LEKLLVYEPGYWAQTTKVQAHKLSTKRKTLKTPLAALFESGVFERE